MTDEAYIYDELLQNKLTSAFLFYIVECNHQTTFDSSP